MSSCQGFHFLLCATDTNVSSTAHGRLLSRACHCRRWFQMVLLLGAIVTLFPYSLFQQRQRPAAAPEAQMQMQQRRPSPEQNPSRLRTPEEAERWLLRLVANGMKGCCSRHWCCPAALLYMATELAGPAALLELANSFSLIVCALQND